ncbi:ankyrin repeat-containing domain protein [Pseudomassariella vexata]|uniref:Ankyrin repeat-containing domain protein n=1 Tax=Pseudomassariella vexata TaxID=1141098 RepID=A0A1Y2DQN1_9PEZI|nr:ankyrin repeat-containing domain protein [Pseudomassariella vexata]ORY61479.1 ankyrin repeat-containing domain protein [Pseudomassariella vexata]
MGFQLPTPNPERHAGMSGLPPEILLLIVESIFNNHQQIPTPGHDEETKSPTIPNTARWLPSYQPGVWRDTAYLAATCQGFYKLINPILYRMDTQYNHCSALILSARRGNRSAVLKSLASGADPNSRDVTLPLVKEQVGSGSDGGQQFTGTPSMYMTALHWSALLGHSHIVTVLLQSGACIDARSNSGGMSLGGNYSLSECRTIATAKPWFEPSAWGANALFDALSGDAWASTVGANFKQDVDQESAIRSRRRVAKLLVQAGASLITHTEAQLHAIHQAVAYGDLEMTKFFLDMNVDPNVRDHRGNTPLHHLASSTTNITATNPALQTPISCTVRSNVAAIIQLLLQRGADINAPNRRGSTPFQYCLSKPGALSVDVAICLARIGAKVQGHLGQYHRSRMTKDQLRELEEAIVKSSHGHMNGPRDFRMEGRNLAWLLSV